MRIVYIDESGTHDEARYFVVAGLSCFERDTYFLSQSLDQIQTKYLPDYEGTVEFHAWMLRAPPERIPEPFNALTKEQRKSLADDVYTLIAESRARIFAVAMEKAALDGEPYSRGFEEIVNRFDRMLQRFFREDHDPQRGLNGALGFKLPRESTNSRAADMESRPPVGRDLQHGRRAVFCACEKQ